MTMKYEVIIYWSADDEAFIAVASQWVETAREMGRAIPEPKGRLMLA